MSTHNITKLFPFCRVKICNFSASHDSTSTYLTLKPDKRFLPICSCCHRKVRSIHSYHTRIIRDMPLAQSNTYLLLHYRKVRCPGCGIRVEYHDFVAPYARYTHRLANFIFTLCEHMSVQDVSQHFNLSWAQVKTIDKTELKKRYRILDLTDLKILCVDEISIRKRHSYLTIIANFLTGQVIGVVKDRKYKSLKRFLLSLPRKVRHAIEAVAMDMWDPYIKAITTYCPQAAIVFDLFHTTAAFSKIIDKVRVEQYRNATQEMKDLMKRSRFLLLKNPNNLSVEERPRLKEILKHNESLSAVYILKDYLKRLWQYRYRACAEKFLNYWCQLALDTGLKPVMKFVGTLLKYKYGILNHCHYKIHTGKLEGINNKIKVIKRRAYGYQDLDYFALKIIHATRN